MANVSQSRQREILDAFKKMLRKCLILYTVNRLFVVANGGSVYVPRSVQINDPEQKLLGEIYLAYE